MASETCNFHWSFWDDKKIIDLFVPRDGETVDETLEWRIERLQLVINESDGYKLVLPGDGDPNNEYKHNEIESIRQKATFLRLAYLLALENMPVGWTWRNCCDKAVSHLQALAGFENGSGQMVEQWNCLIRDHNTFPHTNHFLATGVPREPLLFEVFPEAKGRLLNFATVNIKRFSIELIQKYFSTTLLPSLLTKYNETMRDEANESPMEMDEFHFFILGMSYSEEVSLSTISRYLDCLGYCFDVREKTYYVDGHEREDVVKARVEYIKWYLANERRCYRWVQLKEDEAKSLDAKKIVCLSDAYVYSTEDDVTMYEFHVDCAQKQLADYVSDELRARGGNLSVRKPPDDKPLIILGQDEAVYKQFVLGRRQWVLPGGRRAILPKTEGDGIMVSAYTSRDFGFGCQELLSQRVLDEVNATRHGKEYTGWAASVARSLYGSSQKKNLTMTDNPFVHMIEIGSGNDGYWSHDHMCVQLEDVTDVTRHLFPDDEIAVTVDHSSNHDKLLENGLNVTKMISGWGGSQPKMRDSENLPVTCVGKHNPKLNAGDTQSMCFRACDDGPYTMSPEERECTKLPWRTGEFSDRPKKRRDLQREIEAKDGVELPKKWMPISELRDFASRNGIATMVSEERVEQGWLGAPKGLKQILWERGLLDPTIKYTIQGRKDADGATIKETSMKHILGECPDFKNEITALEKLGLDLGILIKCTPKYHAEMAGEGIEYDWAFSKNAFKHLPLTERKTKEQFRAAVKGVISGTSVSLYRARAAARRARSYLRAYYYLSRQEGESDQVIPESFVDIEKAAKLFCSHKNHRGASDDDTAFIKKLVHETEEADRY